jgi:hypothetical protein
MGELKKIAASTLMEAIVSMVIITLSFGIGLMIVSSLVKSGNVVTEVRAYNYTQKYLNLQVSPEDTQDHTFNAEGIRLEYKIIPYRDYPEIRIVQVTAFDSRNKILVNRMKLIRLIP